eukprot:455006_1
MLQVAFIFKKLTFLQYVFQLNGILSRDQYWLVVMCRNVIQHKRQMAVGLVLVSFVCFFAMAIIVQYGINYTNDGINFIDNYVVSNVNAYTISPNATISFWTCFHIVIQRAELNKQCKLNGTVITINHEIGRGNQGVLYSVNMNSKMYALKHSYVADECYHLRREWKTLTIIEPTQFTVSLHEYFSHFYESSNHCFIFVEYINNSVTMSDLLLYHERKLNELNWKHQRSMRIIERNQRQLKWMLDGNKLLEFILSCYSDIQNAFDILRNSSIYYGDELLHNVLLDMNNNRCVLIDFGWVSEMKDTADILSSKPLDFHFKYSPYSYYFLHNLKSRKRVMALSLFQSAGIRTMQHIAQLNSMHKLGVFALRIYLSCYLRIIANITSHEDLERHIESKKLLCHERDSTDAKSIWKHRANHIGLIQHQMNQLVLTHNVFDQDLVAQFLNILKDIHTKKTMYKPPGFFSAAWLVRNHALNSG